MFGDSQKSSSEQCNTSITAFNGYCYDSVTHRRCCQSCASVFRNISGCISDDVDVNCSVGHCHLQNVSNSCCYTCRDVNVSGIITTTSKPQLHTDCSLLSSDLVPFCDGIDCSLPIARMFCCFTCRPYNPYRRGSSPLTTSTTLKPTRPTTIADCWSGDIFYYCPVSACSNDVIRQHCCKTCRHYSPRTHRHFLKATKL
uniref:Uncharacterized protein n=1 Tax=Biomphalaria glabrata TaxID=6526 RepID=A0A2C9M0W3_BIOGL